MHTAARPNSPNTPKPIAPQKPHPPEIEDASSGANSVTPYSDISIFIVVSFPRDQIRGSISDSGRRACRRTTRTSRVVPTCAGSTSEKRSCILFSILTESAAARRMNTPCRGCDKPDTVGSTRTHAPRCAARSRMTCLSQARSAKYHVINTEDVDRIGGLLEHGMTRVGAWVRKIRRHGLLSAKAQWLSDPTK